MAWVGPETQDKLEPAPRYTPVKGIGALSPKGEWQFKETGWTRIKTPSVAPAPTKELLAPTAPAKETPTGKLPPVEPVAAEAKEGGSLTNLRLALRMAAEEAGKARASDRLKQLGGAGLGRTPGTLGSIADIVRGSVRLDVSSVFKDVMKGIEEQQNFAAQMLGRYPDSGVLFTDSPETAARKASRAPSFLKSLRGEPTLAEKEQYEARVSEAELERKRSEGGFVDMNEYRRMKARSLLNSTEFDRRFNYFLSEGDQERIRSESASPTTKTAGDFTKGEQVVQANLELIDQVDAGSMNQFVAQIHSIIQQETNLTEAEINQLLARYGFQKLGSIWIYRK